MPAFSKASLEKLSTCHPALQRIAHEAIKRTDFTVLCGFRGKEDQHQAFVDGFSGLDWPDSRHNSNPAEAFDLAPYPVDWKDLKRFRTLAMIVLEEAARLGIRLTWGGDFKRVDMPHFELTR